MINRAAELQVTWSNTDTSSLTIQKSLRMGSEKSAQSQGISHAFLFHLMFLYLAASWDSLTEKDLAGKLF